MQLSKVQFDFQAAMITKPVKLALVQSAWCKLDALLIVDQNLPIDTAVGERIVVPNRATARANDMPEPARMPIGYLASQMVSKPTVAEAVHESHANCRNLCYS